MKDFSTQENFSITVEIKLTIIVQQKLKTSFIRYLTHGHKENLGRIGSSASSTARNSRPEQKYFHLLQPAQEFA